MADSNRRWRSVVLVGLAGCAAAAVLLGFWASAPRAQAAPGPKLPELMDEKTVKAVDLAIKYLVNTQRGNGAWFSTAGAGYGGTYPAVMTSLAGLALIANGSTPESGP